MNAKSELEFYSGIIGAAFPGLSTLFNGTPLAQAAGFLSGTGNGSEEQATQKAEANEEGQSIAALITEFCATLNQQELAATHLLFMAFEADRSKIQSALHHITTTAPAQPV